MGRSLKVLYAASEIAPLAKTGGLADVSAALPAQLQRMGHDVRPFIPFYGSIDAEKYGLTRVDFIQKVQVDFNGVSHDFHLWTGKLPDSELWIYLIECRELFHRETLYTQDEDEPRRFALFSRAVLEACQHMGWAPDIIHCNDWHTGLIPLLKKSVYDWDTLFHGARTLMTIHNIGYQGVFHSKWIDALGLGPWLEMFDDQDTQNGIFNFLRTGLIYADHLSTVSPTYAQEIQSSEFGMGVEELLSARNSHLTGILNGVDYSVWSPESDAHIPHAFSRARPEGKFKNKQHLLEIAGLKSRGAEKAPLFGIVSRLAHQKGFDLCQEVLPEFLTATDARLIVLGTGEERYERFFSQLQHRFRNQVAYLRAYSEEVAHKIEAGCDFFMMPSRYEPCGLNQMFSLRYGTLPIVRATGGLADTVQLFDPETGDGNGIPFEHFDRIGFSWALRYAMDLYQDPSAMRQAIANAMSCNFSWKRQAEIYVELYMNLLGESA